jgi:CRISPR/Cas system-associated endonuclease Cas1
MPYDRRRGCSRRQGILSIPAIHWCAKRSISNHFIDQSGNLLSTLTPDSTRDAALRGRQYMAQGSGLDMAICQELVRRRITAQRATLLRYPDLPGQARALEAFEMTLACLTLPKLTTWLQSVDMVRLFIGRTASAYFRAREG